MADTQRELAVIGAGQLGSRHLQALCRTDFPARIRLVDPGVEALTLAERRVAEVSAEMRDKTLSYHRTMAELPATLDLAVVATNSLVRLTALRDLLSRSRPDHLLLEKVVFTSPEAWQAAAEMIAGKRIAAWVNCPRRMNPCYRRLREVLLGHGPVQMNVTGRNYGLACSAIHFLDLGAFLCGTAEYRCDASGLERTIFPSKRPGYLEVFGRLDAKFAGGHAMTLDCHNESGAPIAFTVRVEAAGLDLVIDEIGGRVEVRRDDRGVLSGLGFQTVPQSRLTDLVAADLFRRGECQLTTFAESWRLHLPMLAALFAFHAEVTGQPVAELPIT